MISKQIPRIPFAYSEIDIKPDSMKETIEDKIQTQLQPTERLPARFTSAEWGDGAVVVNGVASADTH